MPTTTRWTTVNGMVLEETVDGVTSLLLPDPQGNVVAKINSSQNVVNKTWYWPYGQVRTGTPGTTLTYGGAWGYYTDAPYGSTRIYVRARYLQQNYGRWLTVDSLWPGEEAYGYAAENPSSSTDITGLWSWTSVDVTPGQRNAIWKAIPWPSDAGLDAVIDCLQDHCANLPTKLGETIGDTIDRWRNNGGLPDFEITVLDPGYISNPCNDSRTCAFTNFLARPPRIHICKRALSSSACGSLTCVILHELIHSTGQVHLANPPFRCLKKYPGCENFSAFGPKHGKEDK